MVFAKIRRPGTKFLNNMEIIKLKDKLGTRSLPTAEMVMKGTEGRRISDIGSGIKQISNMLNITRIHNGLG